MEGRSKEESITIFFRTSPIERKRPLRGLTVTQQKRTEKELAAVSHETLGNSPGKWESR